MTRRVDAWTAAHATLPPGAYGSCEVCRRPSGYSREQRERIEREAREYELPWVREHKREGWFR